MLACSGMGGKPLETVSIALDCVCTGLKPGVNESSALQIARVGKQRVCAGLKPLSLPTFFPCTSRGKLMPPGGLQAEGLAHYQPSNALGEATENPNLSAEGATHRAAYEAGRWPATHSGLPFPVRRFACRAGMNDAVGVGPAAAWLAGARRWPGR